jgi:ABC-type uncharacterized transport system permease subunit
VQGTSDDAKVVIMLIFAFTSLNLPLAGVVIVIVIVIVVVVIVVVVIVAVASLAFFINNSLSECSYSHRFDRSLDKGRHTNTS